MEKEISSGVMLGIVLIALAAIIGLGFGIFSIAKGTANEGVVNVQDNLGQVSQSGFDDYNQKIVTGTQVVSAYNTYKGKPYAIVICTQALADGGDIGEDRPIVTAGSTKMVNYNAKLASNTLTHDNGVYTVTGAFKVTTDSRVDYYGVTDNLSKSGMTEYIPANARFNANLIKDASGTIIGMVFEQIAS